MRRESPTVWAARYITPNGRRRVIGSFLHAPAWFDPVFAGFLGGYIWYDMTHYTLHHGRTKNAYLAMCRYQHMQHHGTCPNMRFGVSIPLWDYVFGTMPKAAPKKV